MKVQFVRGKTIGTVEENFIARLRPGDVFTFAGRTLEFVRVRGHDGRGCKTSEEPPRSCPTGPAPGCPSRPELAAAVRTKLDEARRGVYRRGRDGGGAADPGAAGRAGPGSRRRTSCWSSGCETREGHHLFFYPVEGQAGARGARGAVRLSDWRSSARSPSPSRPTTTASSCCRPSRRRSEEALEAGLVSPDHLLHDIPASLNAAELARRQFREIARVAGLIFQGYPGATQEREAGPGLERAALRCLRPLRLRTTCCCSRPIARCWSGSWSRAGWAGPWSGSPAGASASRRSSAPRRSRSRCWWTGPGSR